MSHFSHGSAYSDALRLILHRDKIDNLDLAVEMLGLRLGEVNLLSDLFEAVYDADEELGELGELGELDELDELDDKGINELMEPSDSTNDQLGEARPTRSFMRSIVAYLLAPDERSEQEGTPLFDTIHIENRLQRVYDRTPPPARDAWRVATQISDLGPRSHRPGKINIRECVKRAARREPIKTLPRISKHSRACDPEVLIDERFFTGPFAMDVDQLLLALQAIGTLSHARPQPLFRDGGEWFVRTGSGAIAPFKSVPSTQWYIVIAGGEPADLGNLQDIMKFVDQIPSETPVTIVWLGDSVPTRPKHHTRMLLAYLT